MQQIYPQNWIHLSKETRNRLAEVFGLERTGVTEIKDQEVISDGYTVHDLKEITLEKMCAFIGSEETFGRAWEIVLAKVHSELNPPIGIIKKDEPWCDSCESKGVRHLKECPKYVAIIR